MKLKNITSILSNTLGIPVNQSMLAISLGITRQTISNRIKNDSELTVSELLKIEKYFKVNILNQVAGISSNDVIVNYFPDSFVNCIDGVISYSDNKYNYPVPQILLPNYSKNKNYSMFHYYGDSMIPYVLDGDKLILEHIENGQIIDNKIYAFCYHKEFFIKRLSKNVDEILIKSENPDYSTKIIKSSDSENLVLIGMIVGIMRFV